MDYKQEIINSLIKQGKGSGDKNIFFNLTDNLKSDKDIAMAAITQETYALLGLTQALKQDKEFLYQAVEEISKARGGSFDNACGDVAAVSVNRELNNSKSFALHVLANNGSLKRFSSDVSWFLEQYPRDKHIEALEGAIKLEEKNIKVNSQTEVFSLLKKVYKSDQFEILRVSLVSNKSKQEQQLKM